MHGFVRVRLSPVVRRLVIRLAALGPALLYLDFAGENDTSHLLILSQVVLSMQLPFALIPLVRFVGSSRPMGEFALGRTAALASWGIAPVILALNVVLILQMLR
jgi:manganese transport protein